MRKVPCAPDRDTNTRRPTPHPSPMSLNTAGARATTTEPVQLRKCSGCKRNHEHPNWFAPNNALTCNNNVSPFHLTLVDYSRTAGMLGFLPNEVVKWANALRLVPGASPTALLLTINRKYSGCQCGYG